MRALTLFSRCRDRGAFSLLLLALTASAQAAEPTPVPTGTYLRPFDAHSFWNSEPVNPVLGDEGIPKSYYFPTVAGGNYSTGVFLAKASDPPVQIVGPVNAKGVWDPDAEAYRPAITIPHWPGDVIPASASDGHADIVDEGAGVIHSFWKLRNDGGTWRAAQYAWSRLDGRGWGDPAHYFQGARAAAVPTSAGLIRKHEIDDGDTMYRHALAMSLTFNGLSPKPPFVFPATASDWDATSRNSGKIPQGALLMLPPDFDVNRITVASLRKVAETLKHYGAYVVDRNAGTPFVIYVENGSGFSLHKNGWNNTAANELDLLRRSLRPVVSVESWRGADGVCFQPNMRLNILSLRGPWVRRSGGTAAGEYDSQQQALLLSASAQATTLQNNHTFNPTYWAKPKQGTLYELQIQASGDAKLRVDISDSSTKQVAYSSNWLGNGESVKFRWPAAGYTMAIYAQTAPGQAGKVSASLIAQP